MPKKEQTGDQTRKPPGRRAGTDQAKAQAKNQTSRSKQEVAASAPSIITDIRPPRISFSNIPNYPVGVEIANSHVKIYTADGADIYFNSTRKVSDHSVDISGRDTRDIYGFEGSNYILGDRHRATSSSSRNPERYASASFHREAVLAFARFAPTGANLNVVTALPANHYKSTALREAAEDAMMGTHTVIVNGDVRLFRVGRVRTILQPEAMAWAYMFDENGRLKDERRKTTRKLIVDIGWGTTDLAVVEGYIVDGDTIVTVEQSMFDAYERLRIKLESDPRLAGAQIDAFSIEKHLKTGDVFPYGGHEINCAAMKEEAFRNTAEVLMDNISNLFRLQEFDEVIFGGGGIISLAPYMKPFLGGVNARQLSNPQVANAFGCYLTAKFRK